LEQLLIQKESERWNQVLTRLMNIALYLAENNIAFRGVSDKLYCPNNGKYLGLIQLFAKFDPIMQDHVTRILKNEIKDHYCGKNILNELIQIMADKVTATIISKALKAKYYSIITDCTPDVNHIEQLPLTIRFVDLSKKNVGISENFVQFTPINDSTGEGLSESILNLLNIHNLKLKNCRGQGMTMALI